ncbi:MAG: replication factor C large subunit [archaeon]|nr:replication factor C large subunit [archaeon]
MSIFLDWVEKYRPRSLGDVSGNSRAISDLKKWAGLWSSGIPKLRAVVISGPSGVGKTASAMALASDMGWDVLEMNSSDQCTYDSIKNIVLRGAYADTFDENGNFLRVSEKKRKLIVVDEADSLSEKMDRTAINAVIELVKNTKQPVILVVNDFYALKKRIPAIKSNVLQIRFDELDKAVLIKVLDRICKTENILAGEGVLEYISENSNGDVRAAIIDLESLAIGRNRVCFEDALKLSERVVKKDIQILMTCIFRESNAIKAKNLLRNISEEPGFVIRWIDENIPYEYTNVEDLKTGYEMLSRADVYLGRVIKRQYYGMWPYANEMMTLGVCLAKTVDRGSHGHFRFPGRISDYSKDMKAARASICAKLSRAMHMSTKKISQDVIPSLRVLIHNDPEIRTSIVKDAMLEQKELMFLMDAKRNDKTLKDPKILKFGDNAQRSGVMIPETSKTIPLKMPNENLKSGTGQTTLF